ncbi:MAG: 3-keto-disaccharide hydrolase [Planctomycetota bacterium]
MRHVTKTRLFRCPMLLWILCLAALLLPLTSCNESAQAKGNAGEWVDLFNGKDLDGWTVKITGHDVGDNYKDTYRVEDGILKVAYDQYQKFNGEFGNLFYKTSFSHYILQVEYRFVGDPVPGGPAWAFRNSGVMIHSQSAESMGKDQKFPASIEVQTLGGDGTNKRSTGNLCTPGTNVVIDDKLVTAHCISSTSETYHGDQWVTLEIEVRGNDLIKHSVNGQTVMEYTQPQLDPKDADAKKLIKDGNLMLDEGYIALQAESHPVEFRKVQIKVLPQ